MESMQLMSLKRWGNLCGECGYEESVGLFFVIRLEVSDRYRMLTPHHIPFNMSDGIIPCFEGVDGPPSSMR